jgi:hypothetical protein
VPLAAFLRASVARRPSIASQVEGEDAGAGLVPSALLVQWGGAESINITIAARGLGAISTRLLDRLFPFRGSSTSGRFKVSC